MPQGRRKSKRRPPANPPTPRGARKRRVAEPDVYFLRMNQGRELAGRMGVPGRARDDELIDTFFNRPPPHIFRSGTTSVAHMPLSLPAAARLRRVARQEDEEDDLEIESFAAGRYLAPDVHDRLDFGLSDGTVDRLKDMMGEMKEYGGTFTDSGCQRGGQGAQECLRINNNTTSQGGFSTSHVPHDRYEFHTHVRGCQRVKGQKNTEECALFTPSAQDIGLVLNEREGGGTVGHLVATPEGFFVLNVQLIEPRARANREGVVKHMQDVDGMFETEYLNNKAYKGNGGERQARKDFVQYWLQEARGQGVNVSYFEPNETPYFLKPLGE
eukprot:tig00000492_g1516.t1